MNERGENASVKASRKACLCWNIPAIKHAKGIQLVGYGSNLVTECHRPSNPKGKGEV